MSKAILVTGALGQIGSELVPALRARYGRESVIASDVRMPPKGGSAGDGPFEHLDCTRFQQIQDILSRHNVGTLYHLAALLSAVAEDKPQAAWHLNMDGLYQVLEASRQYRCAVFFPSSIGAFGPTTPRENTPQDTIQRPTTMYGVTKVAAEMLCDYYFLRFGVDARSLRLPGLISHVAPAGGGTTDYAVEIFYQAIRYRHYTCFLRSDTRIEMMYMPDAIKAAIDLMEADPARLRHRNAFNITVMNFTPEELASEIRKHIPDFVIDYEVDPIRQAIADSWPRTIDDSAAREEWGWQPDYTLESMTANMLDMLGRKLKSARLIRRRRRKAPMPHQRLEEALRSELTALDDAGTLKGPETVIAGVVPPQGDKGPRYLLEGEDDKPFLRMNSNGYLGMALSLEVIEADETATRAYGTGPGAVRFISGTWSPHIELERRLAAYHDRQAGMIFSSAYAAVMGILPPLITPDTAIISDELNHNCIINAIRLARPRERHVYRHLDLGELERALDAAAKTSRRAIVVTDGIFSMRGDHAPLQRIMDLARRFDDAFAENVVVVVDDSHGVGAFGATGRGTEEHSGSGPVDILVATLGKAFGVNGGYVVASDAIVDYLREKAPFYVYSNSITPGEAAAAAKALEIVDSARGWSLLDHLRAMKARLDSGMVVLGFETIPGDHPIVPLMVRDTAKTSALVRHLRDRGILATGLNYPVVPKGEEEIRFQVSADHTAADIDEVLAVLAERP